MYVCMYVRVYICMLLLVCSLWIYGLASGGGFGSEATASKREMYSAINISVREQSRFLSPRSTASSALCIAGALVRMV